jgi:hypothetical protein
MSRLKSHLIVGLFTAFFSLTACSGKEGIDQKQAVNLAVREVRKTGWKHYKVDKVRFTNNEWVVFVWSLPATPDGCKIVVISSDGQQVKTLYP